MASKKSAGAKAASIKGKQSAYFSITEPTPLTGKTDFQAQERPDNIDQAIKKARHWHRFNQFVRVIIELRTCFFNFGYKPKPLEKPDNTKITAWLDEKPPALNGPRSAQIYKFVGSVWREWLVASNVIVVWHDLSTTPILYKPEEVWYEDKFGVERLTINHGLTSEQIKTMRLSEGARAQLLKSPQLKLTHDNEFFFFAVLKDERLGGGLAYPALGPVFNTCGQQESMEIGDSLLAAIGRRVYEQHRMGHEIKAGVHAGNPTHFWKKPRGDAFINMVKGMTGHVLFTGNFDHEVLFPRADPKHFEGKKYEATTQRLMLWGMPLAQIILGKFLNPNLMEVFKAEALALRKTIGMFIDPIIEDVFDPPAAFRASWSNQCYRDSRTANDQLKMLLAGGPLSQQTSLEQAGYDADEEREKKAIEAELPKTQTTPIYDAAHGPLDAKTAGRPGGTPDGGKV